MIIRPMIIDDYDGVYDLWLLTSKNKLSTADGREELSVYLKRNEGISQVAELNGKIVGTVLCGHDGRRGLIYHLAVSPECRGMGIAKKMVEAAFNALTNAGITRCHIIIETDNVSARKTWASMGWEERNDMIVHSRSDGSNGDRF